VSEAGETKLNRVLNLVEGLGNKLPDPATLFALGAVGVMLISAVAVSRDWTVEQRLPQQVSVSVAEGTATILNENSSITETGPKLSKPVLTADGKPKIEWQSTGETFKAKSLLSREGLYWAIKNLVKNFMAFPPLGVVLVGMLGIGIAERTGLIAVVLKSFMRIVPDQLLTPAVVYLGIMSSMTLDAGYVVLPPLAAALYRAAGRSPMAGLAAVFAGVAAGFNANLFITGLDPMLAGFATTGAQVIDPNYVVNPACNWWFMIASTVVMTLTGWAVTAWFVEKRLAGKSEEDGGPPPPPPEPEEGVEADEVEDPNVLAPDEVRSLKVAGLVFLVVGALAVAAIYIPGGPLYTYEMPMPDSPDKTVMAEVYQAPDAKAALPETAYALDDGTILVPSTAHFERWVSAIVPLLFLLFIIPAVAYGFSHGELKNDKDLSKMLVDAMAAMAPIIVLAFFAAQFIEFFKYSGLDRMLAMAGGQALGQAQLPTWLLVVAFIGVTMVFNLFVGSMSAKYAMFAPIFIPMFMMVGISPELTQAAYRIGDSATNIITPLNPYMIIILVFMRQYLPKGGMGTLIATMVPYTIAFAVVWTVMLLVWMGLGIPLGPGGGLEYVITQ
jgi:aminobenzoyl-glutamate transport protein